jgi:hypothetical protein
MGISVDRAKKAYYNACELITGSPYQRPLTKSIPKSSVRKTCGECGDVDCWRNFRLGQDWIPCPEIYAYINQDQKESLGYGVIHVDPSKLDGLQNPQTRKKPRSQG